MPLLNVSVWAKLLFQLNGDKLDGVLLAGGGRNQSKR